ncbi:hypothetical protein ABB37_10087 [Leptomonas pyrrhocoris]|uniref:Uncharacterized protein n=1 Tax=Leptomonas pyrrhocoris TaxID=157538 RepID=A0A0M9FP04_LEPPY|nr:hypothetical protein ABB37_10087 [Leptomonas pyrrhocoris]XP_015651573.1 hypothetical protein ABB37_10087 [Leptomonas pyrrhocoris]XP_015651574.1 hypothetical protein ABB37_10087 [Leptomonas pyrrhocoris]KPA73133.1 hypothetical protein ABB37_10087 [Leptomonas pyrrhocoris]KPA73134.1 hypothetical protein ABB37_10087 [Leptomonas pyrrhocoris]KPA73135.1 hypothetical protein ABB37_10087 [Leptomonas pyrrhocoris]|eukprot:XP_015651572.1 hypothetical protein ABB37_10087 [Leptomonas pyrrhocoris]
MMRYIVFAVLVVAVALSAVPPTHAYTTTEKAYTAPEAIMGFEIVERNGDPCNDGFPGSHIAMGTSESIQTRIVETARNSGITSIFPLGGASLQATCTAQQCTWRWYRGFHYFYFTVFYRGVYFTGTHSSAADNPTPKVEAVAGAYTNWDTNFPVSWSNLSYWGKRGVVVQPSSGKWKNVEIATKFSRLVCEQYIYTRSDGVNRLTPTFPNGDPITLVASSGHVYSFCGHPVKIDKYGTWILPQCGNKFPWWAGLVIAVVCYIILVAAIIAIWCCCCTRRRNAEEKRRRHVIATEKDNMNHIPSQSELGLSRNRSFTQSNSEADDTFSDRSGSESESDVHRE